MIATRWSPARAVIDRGMAQAVRAGSAPSHAHRLHRRAACDRPLAIDATDTVTVLLVDADGQLRWRTTGPASEHSGSALRAAITADASPDGVRRRRRRSSSSSSRRLAVPSISHADGCYFRDGACDAHGGATRGAIRAMDVRDRDRQRPRRVLYGPLPLVPGNRTARLVRRPRSHLWHHYSRWCLPLVSPTVAGITPVGPLRHPGVTLTLAEPERFVAALRQRAGLP